MAFYSENHNVESVVLWATNTGELYQRHRLAAIEEKDISWWSNHVKFRIARLYFHETGDKIAWENFDEIARILKAYYDGDIVAG